MFTVTIPLIGLALIVAGCSGGQGREVRVVEVVKEVPVIKEVPVEVIREVPVIKDEPRVVPLPGSTLYFQRSRTPRGSGETELALLIGELTLDGDCLRIGGDNGESPFVVWPPGFTPHIEDGTVRVRNGGGQLIARVGDRLRMGGGFYYRASIDECTGPFLEPGE